MNELRARVISQEKGIYKIQSGTAVDAYDGMCFFGGLVFFAPVALLVRTQAGISEG